MENKKDQSQNEENKDQGLTRRQQQKPASAEEAGGNYGTTVVKKERDDAQKNYQPEESTVNQPGVEVRRGRVESYNEKTASENQGR